ncbi:MAG TPA: PAS domain-containing protein, partial [Deferrisomatales bacterium]|nr:PAS domain-containing protein [Deferrisomatales bacterium]
MSEEQPERVLALEAENRQLRDHLEFLRSILESTDDAVFAKDCQGLHWLANSSAARVVGRSLGEMLGRTTAELFPPEVAARIEAFDLRVLEAADPLVLEQEFVVEGSRRTYLTKKALYRDRRGEVAGLVGIGRDITERKRAEHVLHHRSAELAERVKELQCLYSLSTAMGQADLPLAKKLEQVASLIPAGWRFPEAARARIIVGERCYAGPGFRETPWGLREPLGVRGERVGVVEVVYLEEQPEADVGPFAREEVLLLREVATRLEDLLERRRVEEELTLARERAEAASRLKSEFVTNISHELRTPMNSILGFTELLIDGVDGRLNADQHGSLRRIERNARKLLRLINEVLDLA